jgi:hypothetical protein
MSDINIFDLQFKSSLVDCKYVPVSHDVAVVVDSFVNCMCDTIIKNKDFNMNYSYRYQQVFVNSYAKVNIKYVENGYNAELNPLDKHNVVHDHTAI